MDFAILLVVVGFMLAVWVAIGVLSSILGGWAALAEVYRAPWRVEGVTWRFQSAEMRWSCNYGGCLKFVANEEGLGVSVMPIFRIGHPPLFFPWAEIHAERERSWFMESVRFAFSQRPSVPMRISGRLAKKIEAALVGTVLIPQPSRQPECEEPLPSP